MEGDNHFDDEIRRIENLLSTNKEVKRKLEGYIEKIQKLVDCDIDITFIPDDPFEKDYMDNLTGYEMDEDFEEQETLTLEKFLTFFSDEEKSMKLSIDPIYLHEKLNNIEDVIITTLDDRIILVPITKV